MTSPTYKSTALYLLKKRSKAHVCEKFGIDMDTLNMWILQEEDIATQVKAELTTLLVSNYSS